MSHLTYLTYLTFHTVGFGILVRGSDE